MTKPTNRDYRSTCLWGTLIIGMGCVGWGSVVHAVLPCDTIQTALTPEEQADESFRMRVRAIVKEAAYDEAFNWCVAGAALMVISAFGLWSVRKEPQLAGFASDPSETTETQASSLLAKNGVNVVAAKHIQIAGLCLMGTLFGGLACVSLGSQLDTILPHFLLDHVLTPQELADKEIRDRTLDALKAAKSGHAPYWYLTGGLLVLISGVGLWAIFKEIKRQEEA